MKTTVEIADGLLREAKAVARKRHTTLRELLEEGLRLELERRRQPRKPFRLKDGSFAWSTRIAAIRRGTSLPLPH